MNSDIIFFFCGQEQTENMAFKYALPHEVDQRQYHKVLVASVGDYIPYSRCPLPDQNADLFSQPLVDDCDGFEPQLLKLFARKLNYTVKFAPWGYNPWGSLLPNGSWNGQIGRVIRGDVDVVIGGVTHTRARGRAVDFTTQVHLLGLCLTAAQNLLAKLGTTPAAALTMRELST
jgi:ABC-type amino acid transport substrate-binding protein